MYIKRNIVETELTVCLSANGLDVSHLNRHLCIQMNLKMNFQQLMNELYDNIDSDAYDSRNHDCWHHHDALENHCHAKFQPQFVIQMTLSVEYII